MFSAWGSIQPGIVNTIVANTAVHHGRKRAVALALWMIIPEFIYSAFALFAGRWLMVNAPFSEIASGFSALLLIGVGLYLFLHKAEENQTKEIKSVNGVLLAFGNLQLPLYWIAVLLCMSSRYSFDKFPNQFAFILGSGLGALAMLFAWIWMFTGLSGSKSKLIYLNKIFGGLLLLAGFWSVVQLFTKFLHTGST